MFRVKQLSLIGVMLLTIIAIIIGINTKPKDKLKTIVLSIICSLIGLLLYELFK